MSALQRELSKIGQFGVGRPIAQVMIVTLVGQKGGIGKSTTAICLAMAALERGSRALLVDADPQGTIRTWSEVAVENGRRVPTVVAMGANMHRPGQLDAVARSYDVTFIDCPPRHGDIQRSALMIADVAVIPCGASAADAWALSSSIELIEEAQTLREKLQACIVITRKQGRTTLGKSARAVLEQSKLSVLNAELSYRIAYQEAIAAGTSVTDYCPREPAAHEVRALFEELEKFVHVEKISGCFPAQAQAG
jgi:chromosome partitioning protein